MHPTQTQPTPTDLLAENADLRRRVRDLEAIIVGARAFLDVGPTDED